MSRLVSRILLSIFLLPVAVICYAVMAGIVSGMSIGPNQGRNMFIVADIVTWGVVALYWWRLWGSSVKWNSRRKGGTVAAVVGAALIGGVIATVIVSVSMRGNGDLPFTIFLGGVLAILFWLIATIFLWRETNAERAARISGSSKSAISCPTCGYNLTGLGEARCPECGSKFTLDELLASQPNPAADME